jgi:hypothetical protein
MLNSYLGKFVAAQNVTATEENVQIIDFVSTEGDGNAIFEENNSVCKEDNVSV